MFRILRDTILLQLALARQHALAQGLEVHLDAFCLGEHLALFFIYVVPNALRQYGKFCIPMIVSPAGPVELRDKYSRNVVLFIRFVHQVLAYVFPDRGIKNLFLN